MNKNKHGPTRKVMQWSEVIIHDSRTIARDAVRTGVPRQCAILECGHTVLRARGQTYGGVAASDEARLRCIVCGYHEWKTAMEKKAAKNGAVNPAPGIPSDAELVHAKLAKVTDLLLQSVQQQKTLAKRIEELEEAKTAPPPNGGNNGAQ